MLFLGNYFAFPHDMQASLNSKQRSSNTNIYWIVNRQMKSGQGTECGLPQITLVGTMKWKTCQDDLTFLQCPAYTTEDWK